MQRSDSSLLLVGGSHDWLDSQESTDSCVSRAETNVWTMNGSSTYPLIHPHRKLCWTIDVISQNQTNGVNGQRSSQGKGVDVEDHTPT